MKDFWRSNESITPSLPHLRVRITKMRIRTIDLPKLWIASRPTQLLLILMYLRPPLIGPLIFSAKFSSKNSKDYRNRRTKIKPAAPNRVRLTLRCRIGSQGVSAVKPSIVPSIRFLACTTRCASSRLSLLTERSSPSSTNST
jgi:hypothetical protein